MYNHNSTKDLKIQVYNIFGDKMKERLKKIFVPIFLSVICGGVCGRLLFSIYEEKASNVLNSNVIYLLEDSSYDDYDSMKASSLSNYIYYNDNGKYNAIIGITKNEENIKKIEKIYNKELSIKKYLLNDKEMINKINEYDKEIENSDNEENIKKIVLEMLELYKDRDDIKLVKIS